MYWSNVHAKQPDIKARKVWKLAIRICIIEINVCIPQPLPDVVMCQQQSVVISSELHQIQKREVHYQMSLNAQASAGLVFTMK